MENSTQTLLTPTVWHMSVRRKDIRNSQYTTHFTTLSHPSNRVVNHGRGSGECNTRVWTLVFAWSSANQGYVRACWIALRKEWCGDPMKPVPHATENTRLAYTNSSPDPGMDASLRADAHDYATNAWLSYSTVGGRAKWERFIAAGFLPDAQPSRDAQECVERFLRTDHPDMDPTVHEIEVSLKRVA